MPDKKDAQTAQRQRRDLAVGARAKLEHAARMTAESIAEVGAIGIDHPAIPELLRANNALSRSLAHLNNLIARLP